MKPPTEHYLIVEAEVVIAKRAIGPERNGTSWDPPVPPVGGVLVSAEDYRRICVGWERIDGVWTAPSQPVPARLLDRIAAIEARLRAEFASDRQRLTALETRITSGEARLSAVETRATTLEGQVATLTTAGTTLRNRVTTLEARVTALEQA